MTKLKIRMANDGPQWRFQAGFQATVDDGGEMHDALPTLGNRTFLSAVPARILASGFWWAEECCPIQPGLIDIKDKDAVLIEATDALSAT